MGFLGYVSTSGAISKLFLDLCTQMRQQYGCSLFIKVCSSLMKQISFGAQ